ncbi:mechanosensitive ion channel family protein [Altererythrobacter lauratis]|uniref:Mechanosensitive ion channel family protein n=1 Tax=Alteraurantiacibacter lauratis TaxID=2054627 RepID=A0ABV7EF29_9SPHN
MERFNPANWRIEWAALAEAGLLLIVAIGGALLLHWIIFAIVGKIARLSDTQVDDLVLAHVERPVRWAMLAIAVTLAAQADKDLALIWEPIARFVRPALLGWIVYTLVKALTAALEYRLEISDDPVAVRSRRTRLSILSRTATFVIIFITVGLMLMGIPGVRDIGTTLLASAGLAALAVGAAAQPALRSLIAGLQMAITEPLRIGDLVVVQGHTGRVEEIRMSYVIVRTWDERAIIVPTNLFLDQPFENWSRRNEMLTGPVFLNVDPAAEVEPIRAEFLRFVHAHPLWDKRTASLLVTDVLTDSIQLRMAMSAATIGQLFDLRCAVREHMLDWLRREAPDALVRRRPGNLPVAQDAQP